MRLCPADRIERPGWRETVDEPASVLGCPTGYVPVRVGRERDVSRYMSRPEPMEGTRPKEPRGWVRGASKRNCRASPKGFSIAEKERAAVRRNLCPSVPGPTPTATP